MELGSCTAERRATNGVLARRRHKGLVGMWALGLLLLVFATGFSVTEEQEATYNAIMNKVDFKRMQHAQQKAHVLGQQYYASKGFFSCDAVCTANYESLQHAQSELRSLQNDFAAVSSEAKQTVGLFSEYGVQEVRELFWAQFASGKDFAKRSSWYDLIFMGIGSMGRDESLMEFALRFLMNMLINFTMGLIGALIGFYWYLWGVISSYEPNFLVALSFFMLASTAATSMVVSYLVGLYSAAAGSVFVAAKIGGQGMRVQDQTRRQQAFLQQQQRQQQRPHYQ